MRFSTQLFEILVNADSFALTFHRKQLLNIATDLAEGVILPREAARRVRSLLAKPEEACSIRSSLYDNLVRWCLFVEEVKEDTPDNRY